VIHKKAGIPHAIILEKAYQIGDYILEFSPDPSPDPHHPRSLKIEWMLVQQEGDEFFLLKGEVLADFDHDLMIFTHPYRQAQVTAAVRDEFAGMRDPLPRWTRTRWLGHEYVKGSLENGLVNLRPYDYRADRPVSPTCRGIKRIRRLLAEGKCRSMGVERLF
jgi:hypothetical protein